MTFKPPILAVATAAVMLGVVTTSTAQAATYSWSGTDYTFVQGGITYWDAFNASVAAGGHLLTFESLEENNTIANWIAGLVPDPGCNLQPQLRCSNTQVWLGASDAATEGTWLYTAGPLTGSPLTYSNWFPGEPIGASSIEDYMVFYVYNGLWNDIAPDLPNETHYIMGYVIESPSPSAVPLPAALPLLLSAVGGLGLIGLRRRKQQRKV